MFSIKKVIIVLLSVCILQSGFTHAATKKAARHTVTKTVTVKKPAKKVVKKAPIKKTKKIMVRKKKNVRLPLSVSNRLERQSASAEKNIQTIPAKNHYSSDIPAYLLTSVEKNLVSFVRNTVQGIRYTTYKLGGSRIDISRGIYIVDCSRYVDHVLKSIYPRAYTSLTRWSGSEKPTTDDYYQYFRNLSEDSRHWNPVTDVDELRPGDILVFRSKNRYGIETGGHVMIVMDKPERNGNIFLVRIADSAPSGHSKDTRKAHSSGIGIGNMLLKVNPQTSLPYAYAWKVGAKWETNVSFAMARPVDFA